MPQSNNSGSFKNLDIDSLKEHALKWAEYYTEKIVDDSSKKELESIVRIQRIVLFKPSMDSGVDSKIKYVLIFELSKIKDKYKDLVWRQEKLPDLIEGHGFLWLTNDTFFKEVYIEQPAGDPKNEWLIKCVLPGDMSYTPLVVSEPKVILYPKDEISATHGKKETPVSSHETFVKNLEISYENDNKIKIKEPGKSPIAVTCQSMSFLNSNTKTWKTFINIIQHPPYNFYVGPAHQHKKEKRQRIRDYDRKQKRLREIDGKLKSYFNEHFKTQIPKVYKLYEKCVNEKKGTYKFKFRVVSDDAIKRNSKNKYEKFSEDNLIKTLDEKYKEDQKAPFPLHAAQMKAISEVLTSKYGWSEAEIIELLSGDKLEYKFDPH